MDIIRYYYISVCRDLAARQAAARMAAPESDSSDHERNEICYEVACKKIRLAESSVESAEKTDMRENDHDAGHGAGAEEGQTPMDNPCADEDPPVDDDALHNDEENHTRLPAPVAEWRTKISMMPLPTTRQ